MPNDKRTNQENLVVGNPLNPSNARRFLDHSSRSDTGLTSVRIGHGTYRPGWRWSLHAGPQTGKTSGHHIGYILSGRMAVCDAAGTVEEIGPGQAFEVGPGHDAWVVGDEACVALDFAPKV